MELVSSQCIILTAQDFAERDKLVSFLTPDAGRLKGIVKGSRKLTSRGVGSFEPFSRGIMHYVPRAAGDLVTIRKCDPQPPYLYLQQDYHKFLYAGYLAELVHMCQLEAREAKPYFDLLSETLEALCADGPPRRLPLLRLRFELRHLELMGYQPDWRNCCGCGKALFAPRAAPGLAPEAARAGVHKFDVQAGGVRCPDCAGASGSLLALAPESLTFLEAWRGGGTQSPERSPRPTRRVLEELEAAVTAHLIHHLERKPRSLALLPSLDEVPAE